MTAKPNLLVALLVLLLLTLACTSAPKSPEAAAFERSMRVMNSAESYRVEGSFKAFGEFRWSRSNGRARVVVASNDGNIEHVLIPPHIYSIGPDKETWSRSDSAADESYRTIATLLLLGLVIFPHQDIPIRYYGITPAGVQDIDGVPASRFRVNADWSGILEWLEDNHKLEEVSRRTTIGGPEDFRTAFREITRQQDGPINIWVDDDDLLRQLSARFIQGFRHEDTIRFSGYLSQSETTDGVTTGVDVSIQGDPKLVVNDDGNTVLAVENPVLAANVPEVAIDNSGLTDVTLTAAQAAITSAAVTVDVPVNADSVGGGASVSVAVVSNPAELEVFEGFTLETDEEPLLGLNVDTNIETTGNVSLTMELNVGAYDASKNYNVRRVSGGVESNLGQPTVTFDGDKVVFTFLSPGLSIFILIDAPESTVTTDVFANLIAVDNLTRVWLFNNATQAWSFFDPRPAFGPFNTLTESLGGDIVWVYVDVEQPFQSQTLVSGPNLISLE